MTILKLFSSVFVSMLAVASASPDEVCTDQEKCEAIATTQGKSFKSWTTNEAAYRRGCVEAEGHIYFSAGPGKDFIPSFTELACPDPTTSSSTIAPPTDPPTVSASPTFPPTSVVDPYVILAVGEGGKGRPHGTVDSLVPLTIVTFFEAHQSQFEKGINEAITIEVYANVPGNGNDCMTGTLLESVGDEFTITTESTQYDEYNTDFQGITGSSDYPVTSEGKIGAATVTISDFQYTPTEVNKKIWFPGRGDKDGEIELCIMTSLKIDHDNINGDQEYYVSHMDSKKTISIDLMAKMEAVIQVVDVDTFLCNNKHEQVHQGKKYTSGQNFRICVGPTEEGVHNGYKVDNYIELICDGRPLIIPEVVDDEEIGPLRTIEDVYKNNKLAIRSVLTAKDDIDGKARITCTGKVSLSYTAPTTVRALRGLTPAGGAETDELLEGLFEVTIEMNTPSNESSSAPLPSSMTTTVAIIGFGSILSVVTSMIW